MPTDQANEEVQEVTPVSEWGKKKDPKSEGVILTLPSGNVCRVRRTMDMMVLLQTGSIPNPLAGVIDKMIKGGQGTNVGELLKQADDPEALKQMFELMNQSIAKAFVEPPVSAPPRRRRGESWEDYSIRIDTIEEGEEHWHKPGTLSVFDVEMEDKMFVFAVAQGAAADLDRFRREQEQVMDAVSAVEGVGDEAKSTAGAE